jgi:hypothetical protein
LLRLGYFLKEKGDTEAGTITAGSLKVLDTLLGEPYLSTGEIIRAFFFIVYHRPNGWDYIPEGSKIPNGESSSGDYHIREACLYLREL